MSTPLLHSGLRAFITVATASTVALLFLPTPAQAQRSQGVPKAPAGQVPPASELLRKARSQSMAGQFAGQLRTSSSRQKVVVPFILTMRGDMMVYEFTHGQPEALVLKLGDRSSRLERSTGKGKGQVVSGAKLDEAVRGTDITYEDLSMKFLYWPRARVVREDTVMTRSCWVVEAFPGGRDDSQYDRVLVWVEKSGAMMKAECFSQGRLAARFEVRKVQRAPQGGYVLKSMTVTRPAGGGRDRTPTYLELTPLAAR